MPFVHEDHLHDTMDGLKGDGWVQVKLVNARTDQRELQAIEDLAKYAGAIRASYTGKPERASGWKYQKMDGSLNEGGRLVLAAFRDARAEVCAAAQENKDVDVLCGETPEQFATYYLMTVIDWCGENWVKPPIGQTTNPMAKYFTLASMFRKGKWQARATWPDQPVFDRDGNQCGEEW